MHQLHWHSETLRVTVVNVHADTIPHVQRGDRTTIGGPLTRVGFALLALAFALLATGQGRALLRGVLGQRLPEAVRPRALGGGRSGAPGLPTGLG